MAGPRSAALETLALGLDCPNGNDFRQLRVERPSAFLLLTTLEGVPLAELRAAIDAGTRIITLEPLAATLAQAQDTLFSNHPGVITFAPDFLSGQGYRAAADPHDQINAPRLVRMTHLGRPHEGSLLARLLDAWATILKFSSLPEAITATLSGKPDNLRLASGFLAAHAHVPAGPGILLEVSDQAAHPQRLLSVLAQQAQLTVDDTHYRLQTSNNQPLDDATASTPGDATATPPFAQCIANQWRRLIDRTAPESARDPARIDAALACAQACLLSARTGEPENPSKLLRIAGR